MSAIVDDLKAEITHFKTVRASTEALLTRLFAIVEEHKDDPAQLQAAVNDLRAEIDGLTTAVTANTPAE